MDAGILGLMAGFVGFFGGAVIFSQVGWVIGYVAGYKAGQGGRG